MKYLKYYETNKEEFNVGDYVKIIKNNKNIHKIIKDFLNDNVGIISIIEDNNFEENMKYCYNVKYDNVPEELYKFTRYMGANSQEKYGLKNQGEIFIANEKEIEFATPEEIESKKYNI
jgi:hypothetical protein